MRKVIALIAVLALVGVTGCAESKPDPHEQYAKQVNVVESNFANQINTLALRITPTSTKKQDNQTLEQIKLTVVQTAGKLAAIKVPQSTRFWSSSYRHTPSRLTPRSGICRQ